MRFIWVAVCAARFATENRHSNQWSNLLIMQGTARTPLRLQSHKVELQRFAGGLAVGIAHRLSTVKRQIRRLQQHAKQQREARRGRQAEKKRRKGEGHQIL